MQLPLKGFIYEGLSGQHMQAVGSDMRRSPCADMELNAAECLEAYGVKKGTDVCYKYIEDLRECRGGHLSYTRAHYMRMVRAKKVISGELSWEERKGKPAPYDSYMCGSFYP